MIRMGELKTRFKRFVNECKRVLIITKKPDSDEFKTIVKASGLGIIIIGLIGFIVHLIVQFIKAV